MRATTGQILGKAHRLCDWLRGEEATISAGVSSAAMAWAVANASKWHIGDVTSLPEIREDDGDYPPLRLPAETMLIEYDHDVLMADGRTETATGFCLCGDGHQKGVNGIDVFNFMMVLGRFQFAGGGRLTDERKVELFRPPAAGIPKKLYADAVANGATIAERTLLLLSCNNVHFVENAPPPQLNKKRQKQGKFPLFTYKTLHILAGERSGSHDPRSDDAEAKRSPRLHFRRGHVRRIGGGRVTWVQQCMVGNARLGVIEKAYALEAR